MSLPAPQGAPRITDFTSNTVQVSQSLVLSEKTSDKLQMFDIGSRGQSVALAIHTPALQVTSPSQLLVAHAPVPARPAAPQDAFPMHPQPTCHNEVFIAYTKLQSQCDMLQQALATEQHRFFLVDQTRLQQQKQFEESMQHHGSAAQK